MTLQFSLSAAAPETVDAACVLVGVYEQGMLTSAAARVDSAADGAIKRQVESGDITGKAGSTTVLFAPHGVTAKRVLVVGLGAQKTFDAARYQKVSIEAARALGKLPVADAVSFLTEVDVPGRDSAWRVRIAALVTDHAAYRYTATFKPRDKSKQVALASIGFAGNAEAQAGLDQARALAAGIEFTRELANLPPNICNPAYIATQAQTFADGQDDKVNCNVLDHVEMERLGFGSLLAVARGSVNKPKLVVLEYKNGVEGDKPYAFVGKGVTFDTGGISIKPAAGMEDMKWDMGGAGAVAGAMLALAGRKAKANVIGVCGLVENMPDGNAQRPGDVVNSMSGKTIEVINTDAEGRLVLCDAITWVQRTHGVKTIVDLATLTGAMIVALGHEHGGLFANDDALAAQLTAAGASVGDKLWRFPMSDAYDKLIDSPIADMKNVGPRQAGSITAAQFIKRYVEDGVTWAHLDIAGMAWSAKAGATWDKGATGYGVRLLDRFVADTIEAR